MRMIKWAADIMRGNLSEARKYIGKAYELRDTCKYAADWCKDMAAMHLQFNVAGHTVSEKLIAEYVASGKDSELVPGMKAVYADVHADMVRETAEIKAMIDAYGK